MKLTNVHIVTVLLVLAFAFTLVSLSLRLSKMEAKVSEIARNATDANQVRHVPLTIKELDELVSVPTSSSLQAKLKAHRGAASMTNVPMSHAVSSVRKVKVR